MAQFMEKEIIIITIYTIYLKNQCKQMKPQQFKTKLNIKNSIVMLDAINKLVFFTL
jgi:hypothetical protein